MIFFNPFEMDTSILSCTWYKLNIKKETYVSKQVNSTRLDHHT